MKPIITISIFSLFNLFFLHSMDISLPLLLSDKQLQNIITSVNNSQVNIVDIVKKSAQKKNLSLSPQNISSVLQLTQEQINELFLHNINNKNLDWSCIFAMGADINSQDKNKKTCLFYTSNPQKLKKLIAYGADVNWRNDNNETALIHHCYWNIQNTELLEVFLAAEADPNSVVDETSDPLLIRAIEKKCLPAIQLLCDYKATVNPPAESKFKNPLMRTLIHTPSGNYEIIHLLLKSGAIADCHDDFKDNEKNYRYALHHATGWPDLSTFNEKLALLLLEYKADPNRPYPFSNGKDYPLNRAITLKHLVMITALLKHGARTNYRNAQELTPLDQAKALNCSHEIITVLSEYTTITEDTSPSNDVAIKELKSMIHTPDQQKNKPCTIQ